MAPFLARRTLGQITTEMGGGTSVTPPSYISVTQTNDITSVGADDGTGNERIMFDTGEPGTTPTMATNSESDDITFASSGGTFTCAKAGTYYIEVLTVASVSTGTSNRYDTRIKVDSTLKHTKTVYVLSGQDAIESTSAVILSLDAGDVVTATYEDDGTRNIFIHKGSTVNITKVGSVGGGGSGGGGITIHNNVAGYILKATGETDVVEGMPQFVSSSTGLTASVDLYVSGSSYADGPYLSIQGTDADGNLSKIKLHVSGGFLKVIDEDIE